MKMIDLDKAIAVIERDQIINGSLVDKIVAPPNSEGIWEVACESPGHCAIGALLFAAGATNEQLATWPGSPDDWSPDDKPAQMLLDNYGIRRRHATLIVSVNDSIGNGAEPTQSITDRRAAVIAELRRLHSKQLADPKQDKYDCDEYDEPNEMYYEPEPYPD